MSFNLRTLCILHLPYLNYLIFQIYTDKKLLNQRQPIVYLYNHVAVITIERIPILLIQTIFVCFRAYTMPTWKVAEPEGPTQTRVGVNA